MKGSFSFNGVSSESLGLICKSVKRPLLPAIKQSSNDSKAMSGIHDREEHEYDSRQITMKIQFKENSFENLRTKTHAIAAWLSQSVRKVLIINDEPDKYYLGKVVYDTDFNFIIDRLETGTADITFVCQPFAYAITTETVLFDSGDLPNCTFTNPGNRIINYKSPPGSLYQIRIIGSWTVLTLTSNGYSITHTANVTNKLLLIDNVELEAYLAGVNALNELTGDIDDFLNIISGSNVITVSGTNLNITSIEVNYIPLWI